MAVYDDEKTGSSPSRSPKAAWEDAAQRVEMGNLRNRGPMTAADMADARQREQQQRALARNQGHVPASWGGGSTANAGGAAQPASSHGTSERQAAGASSTESLANQERNPNADSDGKVGKGYTGGADSAEKASLPEGSRGKSKRRILNRRRAGVLGAIFGTGIIAGTLSLGPGVLFMKLIKIGTLVHTPFSQQEGVANLRLGAMWRWYKTGDITQLRLGFVSHRIAGSLDAKLAAKGIKVNSRGGAGYASSIIIDTTKSDLYTGTNAKRRADIEREWGGRTTNVGQIADGKFAVAFADRGAGSSTAQFKAGFKLGRLAGGGATSTAVGFRVIAQRYAIKLAPLNPLSALDKKINQGTADWIKKRNTRIKSAVGKMGRALTAFQANATGKIAIGGLTAAGLVCAARYIYNGLNDAAYASQIQPAMREAGEYMAAGSQLIASLNTGQFDIDAARYLYEQTIEYNKQGGHVSDAFESEPMRAADGKTGGIAPPKEFKTAHQNIGGSMMATLNSEPVKVACEGATGAIIMSAGIILSIASGGLLTTAGGVVGSSLALQGAQKLATEIINPDALTDLRGAAKGGQLMYGGHDLAVASALEYAGVALSSQQSYELNAQTRALAAEDFQSKSFASRMFSTRDPNSLLAHIATSISPDTTINMTNLATGLPMAGQSIMHSFASILPSASAAIPLDYDYGGPDYGFSQKDLNNPLVQDPYENGKVVADMLNGGRTDLIERAKRCYGVIIAKDAKGRWGARTSTNPDSVINVYNPTYDSVDCGGVSNISLAQADSSDAVAAAGGTTASASIKTAAASTTQSDDWLRMRFFILDSRLADGYACYDGDNEACEYMGIPSVVDSTLEETTDDASTDSDAPEASDDETTAILPSSDYTYMIGAVGSKFADLPRLPRSEVIV